MAKNPKLHVVSIKLLKIAHCIRKKAIKLNFIYLFFLFLDLFANRVLAEDPISVSMTPATFPSIAYTNKKQQVSYQFTNNMPQTTNLKISKTASDNKLFTLQDSCSNTALAAQQSCCVNINFLSTKKGKASVQLTVAYGYNQMQLPPWQLIIKEDTHPTLIVVGDHRLLMRSTNGHDWHIITLPANLAKDTKLFSAVWSAPLKQFVVVGSHSTILTSTDGISWQMQTNPISDKAFRSVTWNNTLQQYLIVGEAGSVLTSNDGKNWQGQAVEAYELLAVIWNDELNQYIAVGKNNIIITSANAKSWHIEDVSLPEPADHLAISWDKKHKVYLVTSNNNSLLTSPDGNHWHSTSLPATAFPLFDSKKYAVQYKIATHGALALSVIVSNNGDVMTSTDNLQWESGFLANSQLNQLIWDNNINRFIAIGQQERKATLWISKDGKNWTAQPQTISASLRGVAVKPKEKTTMAEKRKQPV